MKVLSSEAWIGLGEASRLLGITPATLRRWADGGQVTTFTTPGGHRRFPREAIVGLLPKVRDRRPPLANLGASPDRIARAYRRARPASQVAPPAWLSRMTDAERNEFRERGRRLAALLVRHLDAADRAEAARLLHDADAEANAYGRTAAALGSSLGEAVESFLRFRTPFINELAGLSRRRNLDTREATALLVDAEKAMDSLLVSLMGGHGS